MRRIGQTIGLAALVTVLLTGSAFAQGRRGGGGGRGQILRMPEVQTELKLTDEQKTKVTEMLDRLRTAGRGQAGDAQSLSQEERDKRLAEQRANEEKELKAILNEEQIKRYRQLQLQRQGLSALGEKALQDELKLSEDQRSKVQSALQEQRDARRQAFQGGGGGAGGDREAARAKMEELRKKTDEKLNGLLTEDQKKQWKEMLGATFTFPAAPARAARNAAA